MLIGIAKDLFPNSDFIFIFILDPLVVHLPLDVSRFPFPVFEEEGLVRVEHHSESCCCCCARIENKSCACDSRDGLAVSGNRFLCRDDAAHVGHIAFCLPFYDRDRIDTQISLLWLICTHFNFHTYSVCIKGGSLQRVMIEAKKKLFVRRRLSSCQCIEYVARDDLKPLYFLQHIVLSNDKKGPTIESVLS